MSVARKRKVQAIFEALSATREELTDLSQLVCKVQTRAAKDFARAQVALVDFAEAYIEDQISRRLNSDGSVSSLISQIDALHGRVSMGGLLLPDPKPLAGSKGESNESFRRRRHLHSLQQATTGENIRKCVAERAHFLSQIERSVVEPMEACRDKLTEFHRWPKGAPQSLAAQQQQQGRGASIALFPPLVTSVNQMLADISLLRHEMHDMRSMPSISIANLPAARTPVPLPSCNITSNFANQGGRTVHVGSSSGCLEGPGTAGHSSPRADSSWLLSVTSKGTTVKESYSGFSSKSLKSEVARFFEKQRQGGDLSPSADLFCRSSPSHHHQPQQQQQQTTTTNNNNKQQQTTTTTTQQQQCSRSPLGNPALDVKSFASDTKHLMRLRAKLSTDKINVFLRDVQRDTEAAYGVGRKERERDEVDRLADQCSMIQPCTKNTAATLNTTSTGSQKSGANAAGLDHAANRELERRVKQSLKMFETGLPS